jgi:hypothetical protein
MINATKAEKIFVTQFMLSMFIFLLLITVQAFSIQLLDLAKWQKAFVTLAPVLPLFWSFHIFRIRFLALDEYLQRLTGEAFLWSMGIVGFLSFGYGMLKMQFDIPDISLAFVLPAFFGGHGIVFYILLNGKNNGE